LSLFGSIRNDGKILRSEGSTVSHPTQAEHLRQRTFPNARAATSSLGLSLDGQPSRSRVLFSSLQSYHKVETAVSDAEFYLAWRGVLKEYNDRYPYSNQVHDRRSSETLKRYVDLERRVDEAGRPVWTPEKAKREVDELSRRAKMNARFARSDMGVVPADEASPNSPRSSALHGREDDAAKTAVIDDSWMDDPSGVLGIANPVANSSKKKKKKKVKQAKHTKQPGKQSAATYSKEDARRDDSTTKADDTPPPSDDESVAADVDDMALVAAKMQTPVGKQVSASRVMSLDSKGGGETEMPVVCLGSKTRRNIIISLLTSRGICRSRQNPGSSQPDRTSPPHAGEGSSDHLLQA
jgi:hypothetical protein